jgi:hypothetical protein
LLRTSLCTISNSYINQQSVTGRGGWVRGVVLQNSTVAMMYITMYYHQSARRGRGGGVLCLCYLRISLVTSLINTNQSATRSLHSRTGRDPAVGCVSPYTIINFNNHQRGVQSSKKCRKNSGGGGGAVLRVGTHIASPYTIINNFQSTVRSRRVFKGLRSSKWGLWVIYI